MFLFPFLLQMEQLRRVNKLWASDTIHLRKILLIPIPAPISDGTRSRGENGGHSGATSPEPGLRNSNYPAGSRENPLSKAEAMLLLKNYESDPAARERDQKPDTPDSSSSSTDAVAPTTTTTTPADTAIVSPLDYFSRMDQNIASCKKSTEATASNWRYVHPGVSPDLTAEFKREKSNLIAHFFSNRAFQVQI